MKFVRLKLEEFVFKEFFMWKERLVRFVMEFRIKLYNESKKMVFR